MGDPSGGGEGLLFAFAGVLSLKEGERRREERDRQTEREEKSEPGLGEVVLTSTGHWPPLPLCFTVQTCDEDM